MPKPNLCGHPDRRHYARNCCRSCYNALYQSQTKKATDAAYERTDKAKQRQAKYEATEKAKERKREYSRKKYAGEKQSLIKLHEINEI